MTKLLIPLKIKIVGILQYIYIVSIYLSFQSLMLYSTFENGQMRHE